MKNKTRSIKSYKSALRRLLSLSAGAALIAAVTMAFAEAPESRTTAFFPAGQPSISVSPVPAIRLAQAKTKAKTRRSQTKKSTSKAELAAKPTPASKGSKSKAPLSGSLNINTANTGELVKLPGIGPKKAGLIVRWRSEHGTFRRVVDLRRVKGFGAKSVKKLLPYLSVSGKSTLQ